MFCHSRLTFLFHDVTISSPGSSQTKPPNTVHMYEDEVEAVARAIFCASIIASEISVLAFAVSDVDIGVSSAHADLMKYKDIN